MTTQLTSQTSASNLQAGGSSNTGSQRPTSRFSAYESSSLLNGNNSSTNNLASQSTNGRMTNVKRSFSQVPSTDRVGYQRNSTNTLSSNANTIPPSSSSQNNELRSTMSNPLPAPVTFSLGPTNNSTSTKDDDKVVRVFFYFI